MTLHFKRPCDSCGRHDFKYNHAVLQADEKVRQVPRDPVPFQKVMQLNLASYQPAVAPTKRKHTSWLNFEEVKRSPEEIFYLRNLIQPSHTPNITTEVFLRMKVDYDTACCECCNTVPEVMVPVTTIPMGSPESYGMVEPPGYAPMELVRFKFNIDMANNE